eukprot:CAMPEP_0197824302 /NCGR_PEP_ID=MMETSP1437-20131217/1567_1 /TAXON_ID=49252 ORGANISM="Eucampia antarctica, Strain CCMP1452" /NCGR_SAMPLE_ID=MMETSP1437 /ASSEMBLY_ACC=CAM_ASM_001096 /LENGTH=125 /DNA_ID=CAMNT_0043423871 /DNA_START=121 /DNA_END=498 /DNA_ORIENTATION=+
MAYYKKLSSGRNLALGALIKFISNAPDSVKDHNLDKMICMLLLVCASVSEDDYERKEIVCQLQALQCLSLIVEHCSTHAKSKQHIVNKGCQKSVVQYLSNASIDSPFFHVRQAAVKVLNQWSILA